MIFLQLNGLVANMCLYRANETSRPYLIEFKKISSLSVEAKDLARAGLTIYSNKGGSDAKIDLNPMLDSLSK